MISNINRSHSYIIGPSFSSVSAARCVCRYIVTKPIGNLIPVFATPPSNSNGHAQISGIIKILEKTIKRVGNISSGIYFWNNDDEDENDPKMPPCMGFGGGNDDDGLSVDFTIIGIIVLLVIFLILLRREKECYE